MTAESERRFSEENTNDDILIPIDQDPNPNAKAETVLADLSQELSNSLVPPKQKGESKTETAKTQESKICAHHWMIGSPVGGMSRGCCKNCGKERDFNELKALKIPIRELNNRKANEAKMLRRNKNS